MITMRRRRSRCREKIALRASSSPARARSSNSTVSAELFSIRVPIPSYLRRPDISEQEAAVFFKIPVYSLAFSPDGKWLAVGTAPAEVNVPAPVEVWEMLTGRLKHEPATLWRWLDRARSLGLVRQDGRGTKSSPFRYWLPERENDDAFLLIHQAERLAQEDEQTLRNLGHIRPRGTP
jgi:WD40 repeat protein